MGEDFLMVGSVPVYTNTVQFSQNVVYIDGEITSVDNYHNVLYALNSAKDGDSFVIHINSTGGLVNTAMQLCNSIKSSEAYVIAVIHGMVASSATAIALACDEVVVTPNTAFMVHSVSWGMDGDLKSMRDNTGFYTKQYSKWVADVYKGFMTDKEIKDMIEHSKDIWMDDKEVTKRLKSRNKYLKSLEKNAE